LNERKKGIGIQAKRERWVYMVKVLSLLDVLRISCGFGICLKRVQEEGGDRSHSQKFLFLFLEKKKSFIIFLNLVLTKKIKKIYKTCGTI
jgi:hypothetical protein